MPAAYLKGPPLPPFEHCKKIPYETRFDAMKAIKKGRSTPDRTLVQSTMGEPLVYRCRRCGYWHFGHLPYQLQQNRTERKTP